MAKRVTSNAGITPAAVADGVAFTSGQQFADYYGASATQRTVFFEFYMGGLAGASSPTPMIVSRDSVLAVGAGSFSGTVGADNNMASGTAALAAPLNVGNVFATSYNTRTLVNHLINLSFNAFGGIVRWVAAPGEEITITGNTAALGTLCLSCFTGGTPGLLGGHVIYETD
jgi:hypothetical protein